MGTLCQPGVRLSGDERWKAVHLANTFVNHGVLWQTGHLAHRQSYQPLFTLLGRYLSPRQSDLLLRRHRLGFNLLHQLEEVSHVVALASGSRDITFCNASFGIAIVAGTR